MYVSLKGLDAQPKLGIGRFVTMIQIAILSSRMDSREKAGPVFQLIWRHTGSSLTRKAFACDSLACATLESWLTLKRLKLNNSLKLN